MSGSGSRLSGHPDGAVTALVHAGCALLLVRDRPTAWLEIAAVSDARMAEVLPVALDHVLTNRFGEGRAVPTPTASALLPSVPLLRATAELAAEAGTRQAFDFLFGRQLDANPRQYTLTPPGSPSSWPTSRSRPGTPSGGAAGATPARSSTPPPERGPCCAPSAGPPPCTRRRPTPACRPSPRSASPSTRRGAGPTRPRSRHAPATPCAPTPSPGSRWTRCSATRRSTSATGAMTTWPTTRAGNTASPPAPSPNSPGCSTPSRTCARAGPQWC